MKWLAAIIFLFLPSVSAWADHPVGEPMLEKLPIWETCCKEYDCIVQRVTILGGHMASEGVVMALTDIDGMQTLVNQEKFHPVPSEHSWVCYVDTNGDLVDDNIRCILYPQQGIVG